MRVVETIERERFLRGADFVGRGDKVSFDVLRRIGSQWEHVMFDAVPFDLVEFEIPYGVAHGRFTMCESV